MGQEAAQDVVVVGTGCVGYAAALSLAQKGFQVTLIGPEPNIPEEARTFALMASVARWVVDVLGHLTTIPMYPITSVQASCAGSMVPIKLSLPDGVVSPSIPSSELPPAIAYSMPARAVQSALQKACQATPNLHIRETLVTHWNQNPTHLEIFCASGSPIRTRMLVGADGKNSSIRSLSAIEVHPRLFPQNALVFNLTHLPSASMARYQAYEHFFSLGSIALLPKMHGELACVWMDVPAKMEFLCNASEEVFVQALCPLLKEFWPYLGAVPVSSKAWDNLTLLGARKTYGLSSHVADAFLFPRGVLVGDAACAVHPIAAQGLNAGLYGVQLLGTVLSQHRALGMDWASWSTLSVYERQYKAFAQSLEWSMMTLVHGLSLHRTPQDCPWMWTAASSVMCLPFVRDTVGSFL